MARKKVEVSKEPPKALPKLPFSVGNRGDFVRRAHVAVNKIMVETFEVLSYDFAYNVVTAQRIPVDLVGPDHQAPKQYYVDGHHTMQGPTTLAKETHLQWLRQRALEGGATPDAIRVMQTVMKFTKKEVEDMAAKEKLAKTTRVAKTDTTEDAGGAPVGKGGKVAAAKAKSGRKGNPEALKKAREARAEAGPDTRKIKILNKENPYRADSNRAASFNALRGAKTVEDYKAAGGKVKYLSRWAAEDRISLG
jgi:hypothetical protein